MAELKLTNQTLQDVPDTVALAVGLEVKDLKQRMDSQQGEVEQLLSKNKDLESTIEKLQAKNDALQIELDKHIDSVNNFDLANQINEGVKTRIKLFEIAKHHLDSIDDNLTNIEIKKAIVLKKGITQEKADSYSEDTLDAVIETFELNRRHDQRNDSYNRQKQLFTTTVKRDDDRLEQMEKWKSDAIALEEKAWMEVSK